MLSFLRFLVPSLPPNCTANTHLGPLYTCVVDGAHLQSALTQSNIHIAFLKNTSCTVTFTSSFLSVHCAGTLQLNINAVEKSDVGHNLLPKADTGLLPKQTVSEDFQGDADSDSGDRVADADHKESKRRRKIGSANKGKIPWNKGRKHSEETRALIKQRTIEALSDPKVRRKMSEYPHAHTERSKARISLAQKKVWAKRLKRKRLGEKFYLKWAENVAEAARRGGNNQQELDWDSYEKIKSEIAVLEAENKAKTKELAKVRKENAAKVKSEEKLSIALKKKEKGQKVRARRVRKRKIDKRMREKADVDVTMEFKLKSILATIPRRKSINGQGRSQEEAATGHQPTIEKWDLEFIQREKLRREISLADQIQAARSRRAEHAGQETLTESWAHPLSRSMGDENS